MPWAILRLNICDNGTLISGAIDLRSFMDNPLISRLDFGWRSLIVFWMEAGLVRWSSRLGASLGGRYESGVFEVGWVEL